MSPRCSSIAGRGEGGWALPCSAPRKARRFGSGTHLLTLDTEAGSDGERLYSRLGWIRFGQVPNYAMCADGTRRQAATFFYRTL